jgi:hypothetical protein
MTYNSSDSALDTRKIENRSGAYFWIREHRQRRFDDVVGVLGEELK